MAAGLFTDAGSRDYGAITASVAYYGRARKMFTVPAGNFIPAPKVNSTVVRRDIYDKPIYKPKDEQFMFGLIRAAFDMRRKTLVNAVSHRYPRYTKEIIANALVSMGKGETVRGECLSIRDYMVLSDILISQKDTTQ